MLCTNVCAVILGLCNRVFPYLGPKLRNGREAKPNNITRVTYSYYIVYICNITIPSMGTDNICYRYYLTVEIDYMVFQYLM